MSDSGSLRVASPQGVHDGGKFNFPSSVPALLLLLSKTRLHLPSTLYLHSLRLSFSFHWECSALPINYLIHLIHLIRLIHLIHLIHLLHYNIANFPSVNPLLAGVAVIALNGETTVTVTDPKVLEHIKRIALTGTVPAPSNFVINAEILEDTFGNPEISAPGAPKKKTAKQQAMNGDWRSSGSSSIATDVPSTPSPKSHTAELFTMEAAADDQFTITSKNAQSVFLPGYCVFVANLTTSAADKTLEAEITRVFRQFGPVYVTVKRDHKGLAFAFCQYTNKDDFVRALHGGKECKILGRTCRTEPAKAHRMFLMKLKDDGFLDIEVALEAMTQYGRLDTCRRVTDDDRAAAGITLDDGIIVQFVIYGQGQAASAAFRNHDLYELIPLGDLNEFGKDSPNRASNSGLSKTPRSRDGFLSSFKPEQSYINKYDCERQSVFVGDLPVSFTETNLHHLFNDCGVVVHTLILSKPSTKYAGELHAYGFVKFRDAVSVTEALKKDGMMIEGHKIRVAKKNSGASRGTQRTAPALPSPASTQASSGFASSQDGFQKSSSVSTVPQPSYNYGQFGQYPSTQQLHAWNSVFGGFYGVPVQNPFTQQFFYPTQQYYYDPLTGLYHPINPMQLATPMASPQTINGTNATSATGNTATATATTATAATATTNTAPAPVGSAPVVANSSTSSQ